MIEPFAEATGDGGGAAESVGLHLDRGLPSRVHPVQPSLLVPGRLGEVGVKMFSHITQPC